MFKSCVCFNVAVTRTEGWVEYFSCFICVVSFSLSSVLDEVAVCFDEMIVESNCVSFGFKGLVKLSLSVVEWRGSFVEFKMLLHGEERGSAFIAVK